MNLVSFPALLNCMSYQSQLAPINGNTAAFEAFDSAKQVSRTYSGACLCFCVQVWFVFLFSNLARQLFYNARCRSSCAPLRKNTSGTKLLFSTKSIFAPACSTSTTHDICTLQRNFFAHDLASGYISSRRRNNG